MDEGIKIDRLHNNPPDNLASTRELAREASAFFAENPVVQNGDDAKRLKLYIDRIKLQLQDLEAERDSASKATLMTRWTQSMPCISLPASH